MSGQVYEACYKRTRRLLSLNDWKTFTVLALLFGLILGVAPLSGLILRYGSKPLIHVP